MTIEPRQIGEGLCFSSRLCGLGSCSDPCRVSNSGDCLPDSRRLAFTPRIAGICLAAIIDSKEVMDQGDDTPPPVIQPFDLIIVGFYILVFTVIFEGRRIQNGKLGRVTNDSRTSVG